MENKRKKVLGLDIGTNSIGGSLISIPKGFENYGNEGEIEWIGSRIIPTDGDYLQKFESGAQAETKAAFRRSKRGSRRLKHRYKLRRTRLLRVFKFLKWVPEDFQLDDSREYKDRIKYDDEFRRNHHISKVLNFSEKTILEFEKEFGIEGKKSKKGKSIVPEDWIVYFLRKKALTEQITIPELVRIIYMLNQRRGFKSSRKDLKTTNVLPYKEFIKRKDNEDYSDGIETQFVSITKIKAATFKEEKKDRKGNISNVYFIEAEDPRMETWEETRKKEPEWVGKEFTFLVTQKIDKNGKHTQNKPQMPKESDWGLCTTALSEKIQEKNQHPGEYFYEQIKEAYLAKRNYKARQFPVYRWRYEKELEAIWNKQCELNSELAELNSDKATLTKLAEILYPTQAKNCMPKLAEFQNNDLLHIISNDIIYYQRELKSQKNSISECRYEKRKGIDGETYGLKCIPRSSPLFQEFRIWQDIHNIRFFKREYRVDGKTKIDKEFTSSYIDDTVKEKLFDLFNSKASISEKDILNLIKENKPENDIVISGKKDGEHSHRINLFANRDALKGNEILTRYRSVFKKAECDDESILEDKEKLMKLWHIDYSISSSDEKKSEKGIMSALGWKKGNEDGENSQWIKTEKWNVFKVQERVALAISKLPELKKEYGSYSACAIKKLLSVMRCGKYWTPIEELVAETENQLKNTTKKKIKKEIEEYLKCLKSINPRATQIKERLNSINNNIKHLNEVADDDVQKQVLKSFINKSDLTKGLSTYQAGYLIYDKHSEKDKIKINDIEEFAKYIQKEIPNNSLRNPIVEQVVRETMFLVRDVWKQYGEIDEIHIELGRNLKNNADRRKQISENNKNNFSEKQRIKKMLYELMNDGFEQYVDTEIKEKATFEVKPNPESPVDINKFRIWRSLSNKSESEWIKKVKEEKIPTNQEIKKYALWLSQNSRSPYTGKIIPLSKLFNKTQYEIEHVIPRAKMKNDSFNNLVISEAAINPEPYKGSMLARNFIARFGGKDGKEYEINGKKYFILGENEYESNCKETFKHQKAKLKNLLATEVPDDFVERQLNDTRYIGRKLSELLAPVAKSENGILFTGGAITSELKNNWGLNSVWKEIVKPRFKRLEEITGNTYIVKENDERGNPVYHFNVKENQSLNIKRIDHRHHALDALIVAATTREHIRYLNTLSAADTDEEIKKIKQSLVKGKIRDFKQPWKNFTKDVKDELEKLIVSFKTNNKIISKPKNRTAYYKMVNDKLKKEFKEQKSNKKWMAVRKSMFKEPLGVVWLKEVKEVGVLDAFKIHIKKKLVNSDKEKRKTASYIYDKQARQIIDNIVSKSNFAIDEQEELLKEMKNFLKRNSVKVTTDKINKNGKVQYKIVYKLNGIGYEKIKVAHFVSYKTKRMALTKKEYAEKLTVEKMKNDFPYFTFINKEYFDSLPNEKQNIIKKAGLEISEMKYQSAFNKLFLEHILEYDNNAKEAFNTEGIEKLNKKAIENPKIGKEIRSVTRLDGTVDIEDMFNGGFYETDKGSNVYFVMYENQQTKKRSDFRSIATHKAIEKVVNGKPVAEGKEGFDKIILSPGDLVYMPTNEEREKIESGIEVEKAIDWNNRKHISSSIYKMTDTTQGKCLFVPHRVSSSIIDNEELGSGNKSARAWDGKVEYVVNSKGKLTREDSGTMIKETCVKLKVDRLGNISKVKT
ncbi:hypothetical protein LS482_00695 [Sinomicrobium kalidii]|uniref:type II CRISPR RNA-guided endonuclease Cas9 n=1 Tax=Sinomicrobium kalidii TaxID=2900738 RepID=UPI001E3A93B6|nr:type II CRISPR RNA-guided endonuclease Cas9 [Sinomicrobium kalidii]UGU16401.1 hypothetical protein LS482_00695 [Sinomicrobium kalidii]